MSDSHFSWLFSFVFPVKFGIVFVVHRSFIEILKQDKLWVINANVLCTFSLDRTIVSSRVCSAEVPDINLLLKLTS